MTKEAIAAYRKEWRKKNQAKLAADQRAAYAANPEKCRARARLLYHDDPIKAKERQRNYRNKNRNLVNEKQREYIAKNYERDRAKREKYREKYRENNIDAIRYKARAVYAKSRSKAQLDKAKLKAESDTWNKNNPEKAKARDAERIKEKKKNHVLRTYKWMAKHPDRHIAGLISAGSLIPTNQIPLEMIQLKLRSCLIIFVRLRLTQLYCKILLT